ncbi:MAG: hypothetical protein WAJ92_09775 [Candidatus Acidiferrales bacterium]
MKSSAHVRMLGLTLVGVPLLFAGIFALQRAIDGRPSAQTQEQDELLMRSGATLKKLSIGYDSLLADIYWTRAVQYYGTWVGSPNAKFDRLWPLLDITTTLDPRLTVAYHFGAIFLSEPGPMGAGRTDLAVELVKRGVAANPENWHMDTDLGFLYFWRLHDYANAAATYLEGGKKPGAPSWMKLMAARMADRGGDMRTSQLIWTQLYESSKEPAIRKMALEHLLGLKALGEEEQLDQISEEYRQRYGRYPASTKELADAKLLPGIPLDPAGFPYQIGADGHAHLNSQSTVTDESKPEATRP